MHQTRLLMKGNETTDALFREIAGNGAEVAWVPLEDVLVRTKGTKLPQGK